MQKYVVTNVFKMKFLRWILLGFGKEKTDNFDLFISSRESLRNENKHTKSVAL